MRIWFLGDFSYRGDMGGIRKKNLPFSENDFLVANYEGPLGFKSKFFENRVYLGQSISSLTVAKEFGLTHLSVANNHVHDFGEKALEDTVKKLNSEGFEVAGYLDPGEKISRFRVEGEESRQIEIFCVATPETGAVTEPFEKMVCANAYSEALFDKLKENEKKNIISIVYIHWGETNYRYPSEEMRNLAARYADHGVRLVIGHHPHVTQGYEKIRNTKVFYSLGNFVFDEYYSSKGLLALPIENHVSLIIGLDINSFEPELHYAHYLPKKREIYFNKTKINTTLSYSFPLALHGRNYRLFLKAYYISRLFKRGLYWLSPNRIRQIGPRQISAFKHMLRKFFGVIG